MLGVARAPHPARATATVTFVQGEAERLPFDDAAFDALTFTYLLRYVDDPAATLAELARVVKPGGRIGMVEFGVPATRCSGSSGAPHARRPAASSAALISPAWYEVGRFLGPNIEQFHAAHPDLSQLWMARGDRRRRRAPDELRGRPGHVGSPTTATAPERTRLPRPAFYALAPRRLARPGHAAAPALHGVASQLRRPRAPPRRPSLHADRLAAALGGVLPGRRDRRPCARRAARAPAADPPRPATLIALAATQPRRRGGHRRRGHAHHLGLAGTAGCRRSVPGRRLQPGAVRRPRPRRRRGSRWPGAASPPSPATSSTRCRSARPACWWRPPAACSASPSAG